MKLAQATHRVWRAIPSLLLAVGAAAAELATQACEYRNVIVDVTIADEAAGGREISEPLRQAFLQYAAEALPALGIRVVENREDAYWALTASALVGPRSVGIFIELTGSLELQHHLYIADLDANGLLVQAEVGGNYYVDVLPNTQPERYRSEVERAVGLLWGSESTQVAALCEMSAQLREEGWMGIRELRSELIDELKRARSERARAAATKRLELDVDDP